MRVERFYEVLSVLERGAGRSRILKKTDKKSFFVEFFSAIQDPSHDAW